MKGPVWTAYSVKMLCWLTKVIWQ